MYLLQITDFDIAKSNCATYQQSGVIQITSTLLNKMRQQLIPYDMKRNL